MIFENRYRRNCTLIQKQDILILQGGGNFGNYYMDDEMIRRSVISRFKNNRIIMFHRPVYFPGIKKEKKN